MKAAFARTAIALTCGLSSAALAAPGAGEEHRIDEHGEPSDDPQPQATQRGDVLRESTQSPGGAHFGHAGQFGLRVGWVGAYRMVLRYDDSPFCTPNAGTGAAPQRFCGYAAPLALDLALSGALSDAFEPFLWARFGLKGEAETNTDPLVLVGLGARLYTASDSRLKFFVEPALGLELEGKQGNGDVLRAGERDDAHRTDLQFHLAAGPQLDFSEHFGAYLDAGLSLGLLRYLHSTLELTAGIQGRLP